MVLLYLHNLTSSYLSSTGRYLRQLLPTAKIITPDMPIDPYDNLDLLSKIVREEKVDIAVGASMGGMFAHQLKTAAKVLINPAFITSQIMRKYEGQRLLFYHPRRNPEERYFEVSKELVHAYEEVEARQWEQITASEVESTYAFFGLEDEMTRQDELYKKHYRHMDYLHCGHQFYLEHIQNYLVPKIQTVYRKHVSAS